MWRFRTLPTYIQVPNLESEVEFSLAVLVGIGDEGSHPHK